MKVIHYLGIASVVIAMGCSSSTSPTGSTTVNGNGPAPGTLVGRVNLYASANKLIAQPYSGIRVSLDKTPYATTTDANGIWEMDNIPAGSYDVRISKDSFGIYVTYGVSVAGPGISSALRWSGGGLYIPPLYAQATEAVSLDSASVFQASSVGMTATSTASELVFFFDRTATVQPGDVHWAYQFATGRPVGGVDQFTGGLTISDLHGIGAKAGDTLYLSGCSNNSMTTGYFDATGNMHLGSPGPKSNVLKVVMP